MHHIAFAQVEVMPAEVEQAGVALAEATLVELAGFLSELGATRFCY